MSDADERLAGLEARIAAIEAAIKELREQRAPASPPLPVAAQPPPPTGSPIVVDRPPAPTRAALRIDSEVLLKWGGVGLVVLAVINL